MVATSGPILDPETSTRVTDMPPVVVTTTGIPEAEHVGKENLQAPTGGTERSHRTRWIALALAGVLAGSVGVVAYVVSHPVAVSPHMGLTEQAWMDYRTGERAVATTGVGTPDWTSYREGERATSVIGPPNMAKAASLPVWVEREFPPNQPVTAAPDQNKLDSLPMPQL